MSIPDEETRLIHSEMGSLLSILPKVEAEIRNYFGSQEPRRIALLMMKELREGVATLERGMAEGDEHLIRRGVSTIPRIQADLLRDWNLNDWSTTWRGSTGKAFASAAGKAERWLNPATADAPAKARRRGRPAKT